MRRTNLRIIGIEESEYFQIKGPVNVNKIIEENLPNLKKDMSMYKKPSEFQIDLIRKEISSVT